MKIKIYLTIKKIFAAFLSVMLIAFAMPFNAYAADVILEANAAGLELKPSDMTKLIDVSNMAPGDTVRTKVTVESLVDFAFSLNVEISNLHEGGKPDPAENFIITLYRSGTKVARFGTKEPDLDSYPKNLIDNYYPLDDLEYSVDVSPYPFSYDYEGKFNPGSSVELEFEIHLLGPETDNKYQDSPAKLRWVFTAVADSLPEEPTTTGEPATTTEPATSPSSENNNTTTAPPSPTSGENVSTISETTGQPETYIMSPTEAAIETEEPTEPTEPLEDMGDETIPAGGMTANEDDTENTTPEEITEATTEFATQPAGGSMENGEDEEIDENIMPFAEMDFDMPKTGETPLWYYMMTGMAFVALGLAIGVLMKMKGNGKKTIIN